MACFKEWLLRQKDTDDMMGDFIKDVKQYVDREWRAEPFKEYKTLSPFPSDWKQGWELYRQFLESIGACYNAIEVGEIWWKRFVKEYKLEQIHGE